MENLDFGLWMTAMGMGTVFLLLIVLMLVLQLMGRLDLSPPET
ncbi:MAG: OadG family protein [Propionibacteriaceae bacterium]|nr:OadG family protein [Propionibacteriaceae bacterium]